MKISLYNVEERVALDINCGGKKIRSVLMESNYSMCVSVRVCVRVCVCVVCKAVENIPVSV